MVKPASFDVRFELIDQLDSRTFNGKSYFSKGKRSYQGTVRWYKKKSLANTIFDISKSINSSLVARAKFIEFPSDENTTYQANVAFQRFYPFTFRKWVEEYHDDDEVKKVCRSIVEVIEAFHGQDYYRLGDLMESVRINKEGAVQFVLDSKPTEKMEKGLAQDMEQFIQLVDSVYSTRPSVDYTYFSRLVAHFRERDGSLNASLRSFSYFILHNPLFFDVIDRYECSYMLKIFRDMNEDHFDSDMFPAPCPGTPAWYTISLSRDADIEKMFNSRENKYKRTEGEILAFFQNCHSHIVDSNIGILEVQQRLDAIYPSVMSRLFFLFVTRIESKQMFEKYNVLGLWRGTHLSFRRIQ